MMNFEVGFVRKDSWVVEGQDCPSSFAQLQHSCIQRASAHHRQVRVQSGLDFYNLTILKNHQFLTKQSFALPQFLSNPLCSLNCFSRLIIQLISS